jgi:peroxiredoxin
MLSRFHREQQVNGWVVLAIAVDQPSAVRKFLQTMPLAMPVVMAGLEGTDLSRSLGNATGGLPFTVVVGERGNIIQRKLGKVSEADLAQWAGLP